MVKYLQLVGKQELILQEEFEGGIL